MAAQLDTRIHELEGQRRETEEVLNTIREPLIVVNGDLRLQRVNLAAARLASAEARALLGRPLLEIFRNAELHSFAEDLAAGEQPGERDIVYYGSQEAQLQVWGVRLDSPGSVLHGSVLLLMRDVTNERRIDQMRRDFVANVSHELKTPLTLIGGAIETLQEMPKPKDGDEGRQRFEAMIGENVSRMGNIIEDLLSLARIEESETEGVTLQRTPIRELFSEALDVVTSQFGHHGSRIAIECPQELEARVHPALMIQALVNLLDNALKYSAPDASVGLSARDEDPGVALIVEDEGWGIPLRQQDRIFERFYRVDQSRSRDSGGTGLGLSIARHIVMLHGGSITLDSRQGEGSTFTIQLPGGNR
jgi:two-component system phosphate regulon sensor histidine kinase PhoR